MMNAPDIIAAITPIVDAFEQLGIAYYMPVERFVGRS